MYYTAISFILELQSHLGDNPLNVQVDRPQNGIAVPKGLCTGYEYTDVKVSIFAIQQVALP